MATVGLASNTSVSNMNVSRNSRVQCYLCDLPHSPWAILRDFTEPICRGCCNYEGVDRVEEAITRAKGLRALFPNAVAPNRNKQSTSPRPSPTEAKKTEPNSTFLPSSLSHMSLLNHPLFRNGMTPPTAVSKAATPVTDTPVVKAEFGSPKVSDTPPKPTPSPVNTSTGTAVVSKPDSTVTMSPSTQSVTLVTQTSPMRNLSSSVTDSLKNMAAKLQSDRLSLTTNFANTFNSWNRESQFNSMFPVIVPPLTPRFDTNRSLHMMKDKSMHDQFPPPIVRDILAVLNNCVPFIVRFNKDHSLKGRVFSFEAIRKTTDYELRIYTEYPIGSNSVYQSASGASRQMYGEYRERMNIGRGRIGASSNGFRDLEYERVQNSGQWLLLGELLPDLVRYLKAMPDPRYLPTPVSFSNMPPPPLPRCNTSKYTRMKRVKVEEEQKNDNKKICLEKDRIPNWSGSELWMQQPIFGSRLPLHADALSVYSQLNLSTLKSESAFTPTSIPLITTAPHTTSISTTLTPVTTEPRVVESKPPVSPTKAVEQIKNPDTGASAVPDESVTTAEDSPNALCLNCNTLLEGTDFVQCPSVKNHKFCFSCTRISIKEQLPEIEVCCPSGLKCPLEGTTSPWTFMKREITQILESEQS